MQEPAPYSGIIPTSASRDGAPRTNAGRWKLASLTLMNASAPSLRSVPPQRNCKILTQRPVRATLPFVDTLMAPAEIVPLALPCIGGPADGEDISLEPG